MIQVSAPEHLPLVGFHLKGAYNLKKPPPPLPKKPHTHTRKADYEDICAYNLWMLTEASFPEGKETGKLLRAGNQG